jgi:hypothetical protein
VENGALTGWWDLGLSSSAASECSGFQPASASDVLVPEEV